MKEVGYSEKENTRKDMKEGRNEENLSGKRYLLEQYPNDVVA